ncbi:fructokinase [Amycolatopsis bartoniae]|uniref:Fructokinase n=1 Tax=Amycolatopsis bartoniae TaxID=941986 RepID=A0A8H9M9S6_9PSEU|nr:carbohydrate kinase [Amycolatopsis bartoniae]MBB2934907.1 fructokinase [Amycolatopsis bartoniae]TVS99512.1 carbohydrate kinase [Amycolatopsis bartoniae]GHF43923.1 fructokinase [Amycolatopsis bartoniae]
MIVVGGEALVDLVPGKSEVDGGLRALEPRLGGGPYNVALAAARLGAPTAFLSRISGDRFGQALRQRLTDSGVDISMVQGGDEPTTLAVVALDEHGSASYTFYTEGTADRLVADPGPLPAEASVLCLGTLGMVLEPGATTYETILRREAERGVLTALDPNIRADLIPDADAYRERFLSWLADVRLLKLSVEDAAWLAGGADPVTAAKGWLDAGVDAVVLTQGADGIAVHTAAHEVFVPSAPAHLVDTIGAGDTVQGALLAWLHERNVGAVTQLGAADWEAALGYAARAAAITVSRSGAEPPRAAEMV